MSETSDPTGPEHTTPPAGADAVTSDPAVAEPTVAPARSDDHPAYGRAIPLPPVGGNPGVPGTPTPGAPMGTYPYPGTPYPGGTYPGTPGGWPDQSAQFPPTGPQPQVGPGAPTPPAGIWPPPPQSAWGPAAGGATPYPGWPSAPVATSGPARTRNGLLMALATVAVVVAVVAGVGLGHVVWPTANTPAVSASPSVGSGGSSGSSGSGSFPFGSGGSGSIGGSNGGSSSSGNTSGAGAPSDISAIANKVSPALVDINTNLSYQNEQAAGTGMVLTPDGEVLTNNHVIDGATSISVTDVGNGKTYSASVVGYDRTGDIAVIKLSGASGLQTVTTSSGSAAVGQAVVGVGNAGGTGGTPSAAGGSITALNQSITASDDGGGNAENLTGLIETNADIQPGDSGGSLVNASGQVLGMDTAASAGSDYQVSASQAYAIPIDTALSVAHKIVNGQASSTIHIGATGFLGLGISPSSSSSSGSGGFGDGSGGFSFGDGSGSSSGGGGSGNSSSGAVVSQVLANSAAGQAGVVSGDTIVSVDGSPVNSPTDLSNLLEPRHPGDTVRLQWTDQSGQTHTASVKLGSGPPA